MAEQQLELFRSKDPRRVEIAWVYHDAGYFWQCPMCNKRPKIPYSKDFGTSTYDLASELKCWRCGAWYRQVPGDIDTTFRTIRYGYLYLGDAPDMPEVGPE